jgi:4-hydroxy-3-polyprenylbenzoate decarboxylase
MAYEDLGHFLRVLTERGELIRVSTEVSSHLEVSEIADRLVKEGGPAVIFENVKGAKFPLAMNIFGTMERMRLALEADSFEEIAARVKEIIEPEIPVKLIDKLKMLPKLKKLSDYVPKVVKDAPVKEVVIEGSDVDLGELPVVTTWPGDGGPFITLPLVFTQDPYSGMRNVGMYRMQVYDVRTTGMHWHVHKGGAKHYREYKARGEQMPVAVVLGSDPAVIYAATAPLPEDTDEMIFAGFLRNAPVSLVQCETSDIFVPANAEFVLEGYVDAEKKRIEGPFGDHTGYYSLADTYPVFHVTCITRRKDPLYPATIVGKPPMEDCYMGKATERIFFPLLTKILPEIVDMNLPVEGIFHNFAFVSIDKRFPGHGRKVASAIWGLGLLMFTKFVVIFDREVNVQDISEVIWRIGNNVDPERDTFTVKGPVDALDHASPIPHYGSKMCIDATRKWKEEGHLRDWPDVIEMSSEIKELVAKKWKEYGFK